MTKGSFLVVFYGNENYLQTALFSLHSNVNLIIAHHNYGIRVWLCLISKTYITSSCSPAQPDPVPNRYAGNGSGDMAIPNLFCHTYMMAVNYRQQITENSPPQPQIEIPVHISHPFQSQVQQSWLICGRNSGIKEVGHSPLPHSSRTHLVWPCPQTLRALCMLCGSRYARVLQLMRLYLGY